MADIKDLADGRSALLWFDPRRLRIKDGLNARDLETPEARASSSESWYIAWEFWRVASVFWSVAVLIGSCFPNMPPNMPEMPPVPSAP